MAAATGVSRTAIAAFVFVRLSRGNWCGGGCNDQVSSNGRSASTREQGHALDSPHKQEEEHMAKHSHT
jgi:hypothetical protein